MTISATEPAFRSELRRAIQLAGSQGHLERLTGIPQQTLSWLLRVAGKISAEHAVAIDRATDGVVPKWKLRPDLFDAPTATDAIAVCPHCGDQAAGKTICADPQCPLPVAVRAGEAA